MTKSIWKFPVEIVEEQTIVMPEGAKIHFAAVQYGVPTIWAEVDLGVPLVERKIRVYGTGWQIPGDPGRYIGTFMMYDGHEIYHAFE